MSIITGYPEELLDAFMEMPLRESYVKLELLDWNENFIQEIQGIITNGSISLDGKSSMRRTCNFTMITPDGQDEYELSKIINLNKKFRLYIGYKNNLMEYQDYPEILWFKMGLYVFITANFNHSTSGTSISVTARDKMCLLNGQVQGTMPESAILHNKETYVYDDNKEEVPATLTIQTKEQTTTDENGKTSTITIQYAGSDDKRTVTKRLIPIWVRTIIYELVSHYGKENKGKIYINDVPDYGRILVKYIGENPFYLIKDGTEYINYSFYKPTDENTDFAEKVYNDLIGYKITKLIFPGELVTNVGDAITSVLDKICNTFGNYEYFYDVDGNFIFQEKNNYLNNSYVPLTEDVVTKQLIANFSKAKYDYSFKDNKIVNAFTNNPKWDNIKNDFVIWGKRTDPMGIERPIHYHLAIDNRPAVQAGDPDYRQVILNNDIAVGESAASDYYMELNAFWSQIYDATNKEFKKEATSDSLNFWLDIYPATGQYAKYSVPSIGRRTYAINDDNATCIYPPEVPGLVWYETDSEFAANRNEISKIYFNGYPTVEMPAELASAVVTAEDRKSCFEVAREALYKHLSLQETISIQCLPVLWLEPGDLIEVKDIKSNIYGEYIITNMSIPLAYNGLMSITAMRADQRI